MSNTTIQLKYSTVTGNTPTSLEQGELAINTEDGKIFYSNTANVIKYIENFPGPAGLNGEVQFNDSGDLSANSSFTYDKDNETLTVPKINLNNVNQIGAVTLSTETTDQITLFSFSTSAYGSGKFIVQASESNRKQVTEILVVQDGFAAYATEYAIIRTDGNIFNLEVDINLGNVRLITTGNTSNEITYKVSYTLL
jgi:hypothetical protein